MQKEGQQPAVHVPQEPPQRLSAQHHLESRPPRPLEPRQRLSQQQQMGLWHPPKLGR